MRKVNLIVVHCSDSDVPAHDNPETIREWHLARGFKNIGYHAFIDKTGIIHPCRPEDLPGAHVKNHNSNSLGVCLSGRDPEKFTQAQFNALESWCRENCKEYGLEKSDIVAHNDLDPNKTCPNFDLHALIATWGWH